MKRTILLLFISFTLFYNSVSFSQHIIENEITAKEIQNNINYLASDKLEGRFTGSKGSELAAIFIKTYFEKIGLKPLFKEGYFQEFPFLYSLKLTKNNSLKFDIKNNYVNLILEKDYTTTPFSGLKEYNGKIIFAGYGISAPKLNYDDYTGLDVKGKAVVIMRYNPEGTDPHSQFEKYSAYRYKLKTAKEKGASAVIFVNGHSPKDKVDKLMELRYDGAKGANEIAVVQVKRYVIDSLFSAENLNFKNYQLEIDSLKKSKSFVFRNSKINVKTEVKEITKFGKNIAGYIEGSDLNLKKEFIIIGAHYDHLGYGRVGSLYRGKDKKIHNGADDNASGTSAVIELAEKFASLKNKPKRSIIFMAYSGEELGLLGSSYFVENSPIKLDKIAAMINLDMIGRLNTSKELIAFGTGTSKNFSKLVKNLNKDFNFKLTLKKEGYGPSDQSSFYAKKIPVLFFFTGTHSDYHRPTDDADKINVVGEEAIVKYIYKIADNLSNVNVRPNYIDVPRQKGGKITAFRVYVGTIPDYAAQVNGLKITGVSHDGPAQKAGLKGGDIIINFGGKKITNIYDYMYALGDYNPGDIVKVKVVREGKKKIFEIELGSK